MADLPSKEELVEAVAIAIYGLEPLVDQPVDLDGRPTGPAGPVLSVNGQR